MKPFLISVAVITLSVYGGIVAFTKRMKINWDWGDKEQGRAHA